MPPPPAFAGPFGAPDRNGRLVSIEPYGSNIVRVTIALDSAQIDAPAGYGVSGKPDTNGWTHGTDATGDTYASADGAADGQQQDLQGRRQLLGTAARDPFPRAAGILVGAMSHLFERADDRPAIAIWPD